MKSLWLFLLVPLCLFISTNPLLAQWIQTGPFNSLHVYALADFPYFAGSATNVFAGTSAGVFRSTDGGASWRAIRVGLTDTPVRAFVKFFDPVGSSRSLFAGTDGGVFRLTDSVMSWIAVSAGSTDTHVSALALGAHTNRFNTSGRPTLYAGTTRGVICSTDTGASWSPVNAGLPESPILALGVSPTKVLPGSMEILAGTNDVGGFRLYVGDTSWHPVNSGLPGTPVYALVAPDNYVFAGTYGGGVFLSYFGQSGWTAWTPFSAGLTNSHVLSLALTVHGLFGGTWGGGVFRNSLDILRDTSWTAVNAGLTNSFVNVVAVSGTDLYAGTEGGGLFRRPLLEMVTSVVEPSTGIPARLSLEQNYPNPFNPSTKIEFSLPSVSIVELQVFNMLGQEVATLAHGLFAAGRHSVTFNAETVASGVYFYQLRAGANILARKLVLIR